MKSLLFIAISALVISCGSNNTSNKPDQAAAEKIESPISAVPVASEKPAIDYINLETFTGQEGLYKFNTPRGLFLETSKDEYSSELLNARIKVEHQYTQWFDENGIYSKKDLIKKYKSEIKPTYSADKDDWFVLSGYDRSNDIVYMKGFYDELSSMQGREEGEPQWLWSKSAVLRITYPEANKNEFDKLVPLITQSFSCDFSVL